jgi:DNA modification methylase
VTEPYYTDDTVTLHHGNCLDVLRDMPDASVDAVCTDPPYGLSNTTPEQVAETVTAWVNGDREHVPTGKGFMGQSWDAFVPPVAVWDECLRVLKPGGHALVFAGSRTVDLMTLGLRLAGFEIRDSIAWLYGSGFPKSLDVSKAIDRAAGATREVVGIDQRYLGMSETAKRAQGAIAHEYSAGWVGDPSQITAPATAAAQQWAGWGSNLKPAFEPVVCARKPLAGTIAQNVLAWGTGALNIDGCRVEGAPELRGRDAPGNLPNGNGNTHGAMTRSSYEVPSGRWPPNVALDGDAAELLDQQSGTLTSGAMRAGTRPKGDRTIYGQDAAAGYETQRDTYADSGGGSRFFPVFRYEAKAPTSERPREGDVAHPTVKPLDLMRWLVRLVTPPGGTVLDMFAGSGTTGEACVVEGFRAILVEREAAYLPLIVARLSKPIQPDLFGGAA